MTAPEQSAVTIRPMRGGDWPAVQRIYRQGIATGHAIQASVFPENEASLKLHLANGYAVVGRRHRIARKTHGPLTGQWRDTVLIERCSPAI